VGSGSRFAARLATLFLGTTLVLALTELALRLAGVGDSTACFVPLAGVHAATQNPCFVRQFTRHPAGIRMQPFLLPDAKPAGTVRIFVLGESAALGAPNPAFGFSRVLEVLLSARFPDARFEVFNAAMWGIDSHVLLPIARACAERKPDLCVFYMGNNEAISLHALGPDAGWLERDVSAIRTLQCCRSTRIGQWIAGHARVAPTPAQDMQFFRARRIPADDARRDAIRSNFEANLESMCDAVERGGARVILCTVAVNLRDCPPLGSLHRPGLRAEELARFDSALRDGVAAAEARRPEAALARFDEAVALDDRFADAWFRLGEAHAALGHVDTARQAFARARDRDALVFRVDGRTNEIVRAVAARRAGRGVALVDVERLFETGPGGAPDIAGDRCFTDHVHLTFEGNDQLARALVPAVVAALGVRVGAATAPLLAREACAARLAWTSWEEAQELSSMAQLSAAPPFLDQADHPRRQTERERRLAAAEAKLTEEEMGRAQQTFRAALAQRPDDWAIRFDFGRFCAGRRDDESAAQQFAFATRRFPDWLPARLALASTLARAGHKAEAQVQLREALRIEPTSSPARAALAALDEQR